VLPFSDEKENIMKIFYFRIPIANKNNNDTKRCEEINKRTIKLEYNLNIT